MSVADDHGPAAGESGPVKPWGRKETPSRPTQWVATPRFLTQVGLGSLRDLPTSHLTRSKPFGRPSAANSNVSPADQKDPAGILQPL